MNVLDSFSHSLEQLQNLPRGVTLAILHPDFHGQHRLFTSFLKSSKTPLIFAAVSTPGTSLDDLLSLLEDAVRQQYDADLPTLPRSPAGAAAALAASLNAKSGVTLILDAFDLANHEECAPFVVALASALNKQGRIVLGGRELPMSILEHPDLTGKVALVPVNPDNMMLDYARPDGKTVLEVRALGPGRVLINGRLVDHWDGVLPRTLFFYFVDRGMTTRDEIFRTFWPTLSTREATNVFHVTKRKISEILGTDLTVYWSGFYRIAPEIELHYDVVKFAEAVQNAAVAPSDEAAVLLQNAIALYHGPFLSTLDAEWAVNRRVEMATTYAEALSGLARLYKNGGSSLNALGYFLRAAAASPQREDLARAIMELFDQLGRPADALDTYARLEAELKANLGVSPGPQTAELAKAIRAHL